MSETHETQPSNGDEETMERVVKSLGTLAAIFGLMMGVAESGSNRLPGLGVAV